MSPLPQLLYSDFPLRRFSLSFATTLLLPHFQKILTASFGFPDMFLPEILVLLVVVRLGFDAFLASF